MCIRDSDEREGQTDAHLDERSGRPRDRPSVGVPGSCRTPRTASRSRRGRPVTVAPGGQQHPARPRHAGGHPPGRTSHQSRGRAARRELPRPDRGGGRAACQHPPRPRTSRAVVGLGPSGRGPTRSRRAALSVNTPTVQELLQDASREVRSIMWDITALDGPGLAAAWPSFAAHARDALSAIPLPEAGTRLLIHRAAGPRYRPNRWGPPVDAEPDPHLVRAGQAMAAVADLLTRYAAPPTSMAAGHDAELARLRIAECLLVGSHVTALGLHEHSARLQPARAGLAFNRPE